MKIRLVGDIHQEYNDFLKIVDDAHIKGIDRVVQVGDWGFGFGRSGDADVIDPMLDVCPIPVQMIRGNHDDPAEAKASTHWIPDGFTETINGTKIMYIGGASSIDKAYRTEGVSWWPDEELSVKELMDLHNVYNEFKPDIMITHDCPEFVTDHICGQFNKIKFNEISRTRQAFGAMHFVHQPKYWVNGHWHVDFAKTIQDTHFVTINVLNYIDIEL